MIGAFTRAESLHAKLCALLREELAAMLARHWRQDHHQVLARWAATLPAFVFGRLAASGSRANLIHGNDAHNKRQA
jgi:predicted component of type VI protein secretion system